MTSEGRDLVSTVLRKLLPQKLEEEVGLVEQMQVNRSTMAKDFAEERINVAISEEDEQLRELKADVTSLESMLALKQVLGDALSLLSGHDIGHAIAAADLANFLGSLDDGSAGSGSSMVRKICAGRGRSMTPIMSKPKDSSSSSSTCLRNQHIRVSESGNGVSVSAISYQVEWACKTEPVYGTIDHKTKLSADVKISWKRAKFGCRRRPVAVTPVQQVG